MVKASLLNIKTNHELWLKTKWGIPKKVEITPSLDSLPPTLTTCKMVFVSCVSNLRFLCVSFLVRYIIEGIKKLII